MKVETHSRELEAARAGRHARSIRAPRSYAAWVSWRVLVLMQLREQPLRALTTALAIALGVALAVAVYLINTAALGEFEHATRRLVGDADYLVRAPATGFSEQLFVKIARDPAVQQVSPMLDLQLALPATTSSPAPDVLEVIGIDSFRAADVQPALMGAVGADITRLFAPNAIVLSRAAAAELRLHAGDSLPVIVGSVIKSLHVIDVLPGDVYPEPLGLMDIASAQWTLQQLGRLDRLELRLRPGADAVRFRQRLDAQLPPGVVAEVPQVEDGRAASATRAYRVNLNMLALVALLTGAFLVFATQSLAVLRRRVALGLLRALGVTRAQLQRALVAEGAAIAVVGALIGLVLGALIAAAVLAYFGADLGNRQLSVVRAAFALHPWAMLLFALIGTGAGALGAWLPAYEAAHRAPAAALKAGDIEPLLQRSPTTLPGLALLATGTMLAWLPPVHGLPVPGYLAVGYLLLGAVLLVPALLQLLLAAAPHSDTVLINTAIAQLRGSVSTSAVGLAAVIVSFSLMVAMAIMVHSFRDSFDLWLVKLLPADLQLRTSAANDSATLTAREQQCIEGLPGVARAEFRRVQSIYLRTDQPPVTLIARDIEPERAAAVLPLLQTAARPPPSLAPEAWISESLQQLYGQQPGGWLELPLGGRLRRFFIAGVWRDYVRPAGAVVIARRTYVAATADTSASEAAIWRRPGGSGAGAQVAVRGCLLSPGAFELLSNTALRERSLTAFDRAFVITYALEGVAVLIGLAGISVAASATALARRAQFGMLRHIGMLRRQILGMLAVEGLAQSAMAVAWGLTLGAGLSVILIYVINRQSFHWSIDLSVPWGELALLSATLIGAAVLTAVWSGRAAMGPEVIRAVREDW